MITLVSIIIIVRTVYSVISRYIQGHSAVFNHVQAYWGTLTLFRIGLLRAAHVGMGGGGKKALSLKFVIHSTMIKVGTVIGYLKKIQKIFESHDTSLQFYWHQHFFTLSEKFALSRNADMDCILIHFDFFCL